MNGIYLIIGGNEGDRLEMLDSCKVYIEKNIGMITRCSSIYETAAWGKTDQNSFLNQVLMVHTLLSPEQLMNQCLRIEKWMGRERKEKWSSRSIDIDILFYQNEIINMEGLIIPHPRIPERNFVLTPMCEIAENEIHPVLYRSMIELLNQCEDPLLVEKYHL